MNCGFDSPDYLNYLKENNINELEEYINKDRKILDISGLNCLHINTYLSQQTFKLLPFHRILVLNWSHTEPVNTSKDSFNIDNPAFSPILKEMIRAALSNYNKLPTNNRFSDQLMNYSLYLYIMSGKACYEILCANLPMPKASTIRKNDNFFHYSLLDSLSPYCFHF